MSGSPEQLLETALTRPSDLTPAAVDSVVAAFDPRDPTEWVPALAAILYARPDLAGSDLLDRLGALLELDRVAEPVVDVVAIALTDCAASALAAPALGTLLRLLRVEALAPGTRARLVSVLRAYANWCPERLDVDRLLELAATPPLRLHRDSLLGHVLEPLLARDPGRRTGAVVDRIQAVFAGCPRLPYTLNLIAEHTGAAPTEGQRAAGLAAPAFPARAVAHTVLMRQPFHVLVVLNVRIGQGDEIVRLVALLQALLDANPELRVVVVTRRTHLYDHGRIRTIPILDHAAVRAALAMEYDGVIHVREPGLSEVAWDPSLDARVRDLLAARRPTLVIIADVGHNTFIYRAVELNGRDIVAERTLDRPSVGNVYDGCTRLLAELGLRGRIGEERPTGPSVLTGTPSPDAARAWARVTEGLSAPIALVNPFGGAHRIKGYPPDRPERLAAEVTGLVGEGYGVVLVPNGTTWGSRHAVSDVVGRLAPSARRQVAMAPDPAEPDLGRRVGFTERPELSDADRGMRLLKYFAASADLVVTVEGWMDHLAYALGGPFRLVLQAQSELFDWHPPLRGRCQRVVPALSPRAARPHPETLGETEPPPLPPKHRKPLFEAAVAGLPALGSRAVPLLSRALASEDHDVRAAAVAALGRLLPAETPRGLVLAALGDREPAVRGAAAEALLADPVACALEPGPRFREHLLAHRAIARQDWAAVRNLGGAALPALFVAADGENGPIRREARWMVAKVLAALGVPFVERRERDRGMRPPSNQ